MKQDTRLAGLRAALYICLDETSHTLADGMAYRIQGRIEALIRAEQKRLRKQRGKR